VVPPSRRLRLAPSLLSADFSRLGEDVERAEAGGADAFHLDVMDGHFVPNISFGPALVKAVRSRTRLPLDIHLMVEDPGRYLEAFARAGGDTLVFHLEAHGDPEELIAQIHALGVHAGAALRPETPFARAASLVPHLEQVMVMGVNPGFSGQSFLPAVLPKIREAREAIDQAATGADVSIDGGVTMETGPQCAREGATFFVCGNSVFGQGSVPANLAALRRAVLEGAARAVP
jgi:ribulose-phosphate 3-epimerase